MPAERSGYAAGGPRQGEFIRHWSDELLVYGADAIPCVEGSYHHNGSVWEWRSVNDPRHQGRVAAFGRQVVRQRP